MNRKPILPILALFGFLAASRPALPAVLSATVAVNAAVTVNSFAPVSVFGNNAAYWISNADNVAAQPKVQAAGNYFIRYPGGSSSDDFHWNGTGAYDPNGWWTPDNTAYTPGFQGNETYRGTTSSYGTPSFLTDGNNATAWKSHPDTYFPNHQWVYVDLLSGQAAVSQGLTSATVNAVTIVWGTPYATQFTVQAWYNTSGWPVPYQDQPETHWLNTTAVNVTGTGGTQGVTFSPVVTRYIRILLTASSVSPAQYSIAEFKCYAGVNQVSQNVAGSTNNSPNQSWCVASSTDPADSLNYLPTFHFEKFMDYIHAFSPAGVPMITVNYGTGTPQEAAAWVHYANVVKGYGIKYWQIGNETEGSWETGGPINTRDYVQRYIEYYDAMKAEDPSIIITGPVAGGFNDSANLYDGTAVVQDFIAFLHAMGKDSYINALDFHWYPNYGNYTDAAALASTSTLDTYKGQLTGWLGGVANASTIPVLMTEYNVDPGDENFQLRLPEGLWVADALGHFVTDFGNRGYTNLWDTLNGGSGTTSTTGGDLGYLQVTGGPYQYQERASYWAMQMVAARWSQPGSSASHALLSSTSNQPLLAVYADRRPDGDLSLLMVNKDPSNDYAVTVNLSAFTPNASAAGWRFDSTNYAWTTAAVPYHASPDQAPTTFTQPSVSSSFPVTLGHYSITVLQLSNASFPTNTPTATPTITYTPTSTPTVHYGPVTLIDDFEDPSRNGVPPARTNLWGGPWETSVDPHSVIGVVYGVPGAAGTNNSAHVTGTIGMVPTPGWSNYDTRLYGGWPPTPFNAAAAGLVGVQFWFYGDGAQYRVCLTSSGVTDNDYYGVNITPPAGQWSFYQIPYVSMTRQGWGTQTGLPTNYGATDVTGVMFKTQGAGGPFDYKVDQVAFYDGTAAYTPTGTQTPSMTFTRTLTPTQTLTPTISPTPTWTLTPTDTLTWTITPTSTWSPTPTATEVPGADPVIWPNPVKDQDTVNLRLSLPKEGQVRVRYFTTANRMVGTTGWLDEPAGIYDLPLPLQADGGKPFSNGLYFMVVETPAGKKTLKLVVLH